MRLPATPHDALFRALVSNPARAGALLSEYLPPEVAGLLDPDTPPEAMEGSFVDADAARTQCDALFRVRLRTGHDARIYVLLEHKSFVECARLTGASAAGESPAGRRRQATTSTPSHGPSSARTGVKR